MGKATHLQRRQRRARPVLAGLTLAPTETGMKASSHPSQESAGAVLGRGQTGTNIPDAGIRPAQRSVTAWKPVLLLAQETRRRWLAGVCEGPDSSQRTGLYRSQSDPAHRLCPGDREPPRPPVLIITPSSSTGTGWGGRICEKSIAPAPAAAGFVRFAGLPLGSVVYRLRFSRRYRWSR